MEAEIQSTRNELKELKAMHDDAQISKEAAQSELAKHEKVVYAERKQREIELAKMKKEAEEKKIQHERIERRIVRSFYMYTVKFCNKYLLKLRLPSLLRMLVSVRKCSFHGKWVSLMRSYIPIKFIFDLHKIG